MPISYGGKYYEDFLSLEVERIANRQGEGSDMSGPYVDQDTFQRANRGAHKDSTDTEIGKMLDEWGDQIVDPSYPGVAKFLKDNPDIEMSPIGDDLIEKSFDDEGRTTYDDPYGSFKKGQWINSKDILRKQNLLLHRRKTPDLTS